MEQFNNPQPSPERGTERGTFDKAVELIKTNYRAIKLLVLVIDGYWPSQEELPSIDVRRLVGELRKRYPTIEDIQKDLSEVVDKQISVVFQEGWTQEEYKRALEKKKLQYKREAVKGIVSALTPVYEGFGAMPSEENKARIIKNLTTAIDEAKSGNISSYQIAYVKKNLLAASNQQLTPNEARRIIQAAQVFFEIWQQYFPGEPDREIKDIIKIITEKSGLALEELGELGIPEKETLPERYELKGSKIVIEYPGRPIEIYLGGKRLQIIDVRNDPQWNADYLLIDPETFDPMNPTRGFKGIRENEPFLLGRDYQWRFELPDTVSRTHIRIELKNGKLIIEDLNSTNGTVVQLKKSRQPSKEQIEVQEASPERERAIVEFKEYVKKHQLEIERKLQQGWDLEKIFYRDFYNRNIDRPKYRKDDPTVQRLLREYSAQINKVIVDLLREAQLGSGLKGWHQGEYWFVFVTNGGYQKKTALGRFYLNLKPEYVGKVFSQAVMAFRDAGLHSAMKIPTFGNTMTLNRFDKMVIYFDAEEEEKALQVLENLHQKNPEAFDEGIPRFTAEVKNQRGEKMVGIGFGQEPVLENESFGTVRAKILAEVYLDAKYSGHYVFDPDFDFEESFRRACLKYQVDPQNPAFNLGGSEKFPELMRRMRV
jgi:transcriptional regulator NrdR family protein